MPREPLPVDVYLEEILATVRKHRAVVVTAAPGAGKTTRIAPALAVDGPLILLQPRRVAARAIAARIAAEGGWRLGEEIGWQVRFDRRCGPKTRLLVATEGILTARLQNDPLLSAFTTVVLDEFHERTVHADLALAMARQAWRARGDLRLVVMSATLDTDPLSSFLDNCPVIRIPGRLHPLDITHSPAQPLQVAVEEMLDATPGQILCFLPGAPEIRRALADLLGLASRRSVKLVPLHGSLEGDAQDAAIRPAPGRRIILATNIAETSLTVPGVTAVIDTGLHKVVRFDARRGLDVLVTEKIPRDSADQRAGRAGRLQPGLVRRLWDPRDRLRPHREPEIHRIDLSAVLMDVLAWGSHPEQFEWFDRPPGAMVQSAWQLLERLGAVEGGRLTDFGQRLQRFPLQPRLGCILLAGRGAREAARGCALLSEGRFVPDGKVASSSDILLALEEWHSQPAPVRRAAEEIERLARAVLGGDWEATASESFLRKALFAGYADRLAQRRAAGSPRLVLASGHGAFLSEESSVRGGEYLVALDLQGSDRGPVAEARVSLASLVDREWITPTGTRIDHRYDQETGRVKAVEVQLYGQIILAERPVEPNPQSAATMLADAILRRGLDAENQRLLHRLRFAGFDPNVTLLVREACVGASQISGVSIGKSLPVSMIRDVERLAPDKLKIPSGRWVRLDYPDGGGVSAAVKLQELFGLAETPRIGPRREAVLFVLLAPNGRPVQQTSDLKSFWENGYPQVRKELRGRYPKHPWPEDPWTAQPTARTRNRR